MRSKDCNYHTQIFEIACWLARACLRSCGYHSNSYYVIQCTHCNVQYVGRTGCILRDRVLHHRNKFFGTQLLRPLLYKHFDQHGWTHFSITPIRQVHPEMLQAEETRLIDLLNTVHPHGLNSKRGDDPPIP